MQSSRAHGKSAGTIVYCKYISGLDLKERLLADLNVYHSYLCLMAKAAKIKTETKSFLDNNRQIIFAVGQTYSVNP